MAEKRTGANHFAKIRHRDVEPRVPVMQDHPSQRPDPTINKDDEGTERTNESSNDRSGNDRSSRERPSGMHAERIERTQDALVSAPSSSGTIQPAPGSAGVVAVTPSGDAGTPPDPPPSTNQPPSQTAPSTVTATQAAQTATETVIDINDPNVKVKGPDGRIVPISELGKQVTGQSRMLSKHQRTIAKLQPLAELGKQVATTPIATSPQPVAQPVAQTPVASSTPAQQPAPQVQSDDEPKYPQGFGPGDPEYDAADRAWKAWDRRQLRKEILSELQPVIGFATAQNQQAEQVRKQTEQADRLEAENKAVAQKWTEYLPFDYQTLPDDQKMEVMDLVAQAAEERGFSFKENMRTHQLSDLFIENVVRDAAEAFGASSTQTTQTTTTAQQTAQAPALAALPADKPLVGREPPKPPLIPHAGASTLTAPQATPTERRKQNRYSIHERIRGTTS